MTSVGFVFVRFGGGQMEAIPNSPVDADSTGTTGAGEGLEEGMRCLIYLIFCDIIL